MCLIWPFAELTPNIQKVPNTNAKMITFIAFAYLGAVHLSTGWGDCSIKNVRLGMYFVLVNLIEHGRSAIVAVLALNDPHAASDFLNRRANIFG